MYLTLKVTTNTEGTVSRDCRSFDTIEDARVRFHSDLASNIGKEGISFVMCDLLNEDGRVLNNETWKAPEEE